VAKEVLSIKGLTKRFGKVTAIDHLDLQVKKGEWIAIMGPSGSGKTTLLNILSCLDIPSEGSYVLDGMDASSLTEKQYAAVRREKIGLIFQQFHLVPYLNALENVMLAQYYHSISDEKDARVALNRVGMGHRIDHLPSQLSGGEQQRVCVARALINQPAIILADEPTGNLDEENERIVLDFFRQLHQEGRTIIMVTHNPEMGECAQRIVRLHHGKVVNY
jgi:putative ABC transport system ATP-binding protein